MKERIRTYIHISEANKIAGYIEDSPDCETGGELFGTWTNAMQPIIQYATGPGPKSYRAKTFFKQDLAYLEEIGQQLHSKYALQHLGTWHSHHTLGLTTPSGHDAQTMASAVKEYQLLRFLLVIGNLQKNEPTMGGFIFKLGKGTTYNEVAWRVLPTSSPYREHFDREFPDLVIGTLHPNASIQRLAIEVEHPIEERFVEFAKTSWVSSEEGKAVFARIYQTISSQYEGVRTFQDTDGDVLFLIPQEAFNLKIKFPSAFPIAMPKVYQDQDGVQKLLENSPKWGGGNFTDTETEVLQFIQSVITMLTHQNHSYGSGPFNQGSASPGEVFSQDV